MARRNASLKPHLNQIRTWVGEGVTDIWIAHQLGSTPASIASFRRQHGLTRGGPEPLPPAVAAAGLATAAPLSAEPGAEPDDADDETAAATDDGSAPAKRRRRGRRGGRGRRRGTREAPTATIERDGDDLVIRIGAAIVADAGAWGDAATATATLDGDAIVLRPLADDDA